MVAFNRAMCSNEHDFRAVLVGMHEGKNQGLDAKSAGTSAFKSHSWLKEICRSLPTSAQGPLLPAQLLKGPLWQPSLTVPLEGSTHSCPARRSQVSIIALLLSSCLTIDLP